MGDVAHLFEVGKLRPFGGLIAIPQKPMNTDEYRQWVEAEQARLSGCREDAVDLDGMLCSGYRLSQAITPGIYIREFKMPAGQIVFSKVHRQTHPYVITEGLVHVFDGEQVQTIKAPFKGVTKAGTKRVLHVLENTTWITFHPIDEGVTVEDCNRDGVIVCDTFAEFTKLEQEGRQ